MYGLKMPRQYTRRLTTPEEIAKNKIFNNIEIHFDKPWLWGLHGLSSNPTNSSIDI